MFSPPASGDLLHHFPPVPRWRPVAAAEHAPGCPRCASPNTKFCYYNNYSLSQPRYFCKGCKRYWTKGGSLRNVPVGGGCRKNRRRRPSRTPSHTNNNNYNPNPNPNVATTNTIDPPGHGSGHGSGIDLAAVYANFLNPKAAAAAISSGSEQDEGTFESPQSEFPDVDGNVETCYDSSMMSTMYSVDQEPGFLIPDDPGRVVLQEQELVSMSSFHQIQSLLDDGLVQDVLWSSPDQTRPDQDLPTWQSVMQLQDLDLLQTGSDAGDCLKVDPGFNLALDSWTSFNFQCI